MNLLAKKKIFFLISGLLFLLSVASIAIFGLNLSIDFTGGSVFEYEFINEEANLDEVSEVFTQQGLEVVENFWVRENVLLVRTNQAEVEVSSTITQNLNQKYPDTEQVLFETVGPSIGAETASSSFRALTVASIGIVLYIAFAFRNVPKPHSGFRFGISAIIAMLHDSVIVLGVFSILGRFAGVSIDSLFITAVLTVIGFSVHDTIVVFDRVRENLKKLPKRMSFSEITDYSITETLNRSLATSLTVLVVLFSMYLLGGESIRNFVLALLIGIALGTYSSIFVASPVLVVWEEFIEKRKSLKKGK